SPDVELAGLLKSLELPTRFSANLPRYVKSVVDDLVQFQDDQGLMAYWPGGAGDIQLTAQAVEFLTATRAAGLPSNEKALQRATEALKRVLRSNAPGLVSSCRFSQQTSALLSLGRAQQLDEHYWLELFHNRDRLDITSRADLAMAGTL